MAVRLAVLDRKEIAHLGALDLAGGGFNRRCNRRESRDFVRWVFNR